MKVWDFLGDFADALQKQLEEDEKRWGDTWTKRIRGGQEQRIFGHLFDYYDQFQNAEKPIPWLQVAGLALIAWIRENNPELFPE